MGSYGPNTSLFVFPSYADSPNINFECFQSVTQGQIWNFPFGTSYWCLGNFGFGLGMLALTFNLNARRQRQAELWLLRPNALHSTFHGSQSYLVRCRLKRFWIWECFRFRNFIPIFITLGASVHNSYWRPWCPLGSHICLVYGLLRFEKLLWIYDGMFEQFSRGSCLELQTLLPLPPGVGMTDICHHVYLWQNFNLFQVTFLLSVVSWHLLWLLSFLFFVVLKHWVLLCSLGWVQVLLCSCFSLQELESQVCCAHCLLWSPSVLLGPI